MRQKYSDLMWIHQFALTVILGCAGAGLARINWKHLIADESVSKNRFLRFPFNGQRLMNECNPTAQHAMRCEQTREISHFASHCFKFFTLIVVSRHQRCQFDRWLVFGQDGCISHACNYSKCLLICLWQADHVEQYVNFAASWWKCDQRDGPTREILKSQQPITDGFGFMS